MAEGSWNNADIDRVIISEGEIREKTDELAKQVAADYADAESLLLVGVLKGALMFMADISRAIGRYGPPVELEFMAVSSYGQGTTSSGVVRILKDLDRDIAGRPAWCGSSRTSTGTSPAGMYSSSRTSSTPGSPCPGC
jgi:hypoxanthine phosphoribosyltransferase